MLEYIILGFLMHRDGSGYDFKQQFSMSMANFYDASFGSIYPTLNKLEKSGEITVRESIDAGKYKKIYSITEEGKAKFLQWMEEPIELNRARFDHLVKIFFFRYIDKEKQVKLISDFIGVVGETKKGLEGLEEQINKCANTYELATLTFGKAYYDFLMAWCSKFIADIQNDQVQ